MGGPRSRACSYLKGEVHRLLRQQVRGCDSVVIMHYREQWLDRPEVASETSAGNAMAHLLNFSSFVQELGARLVIVGDVASLPEDPRHCLPSTFSPHAADACKFRARSGDGVDDMAYKALAAASAHVDFFPTYDLLCDPSQPGDACGALIPGTSTFAYSDKHHLTSAGAFYLWPHLCHFFRTHGLLGPSA